MLIELNVTNYRSFLQTQTLQMAASPSDDLQEENSFPPPAPGLPRLLRSSVIYGPNAAGKSNLIKALFFMKQFVLVSAQGQEGDSILTSPFLFDKHSPSEPSDFEAIFVVDDVRYQYGFSTDTKRVTHEWLLAYPQGRAQRWFERSYNPKIKQDEYYFGSKFTGSKKIWQDATRANSLFLSAAIQLNNEQLKPVFYWFRNLVVIRHQELLDPGFSMLQCETEHGRNGILEFMNAADLSIDTIKCESKDFTEKELPVNMPPELKEKLLGGGKKMTKVFFGHQVGDSDEMAWLPLEEESDGTKKLFAYAGPWLEGLKHGRILLVDELDNNLHPSIVCSLLKLINNSKINKKNGQLIFAAQDMTLLDQKIMRRDQVWFVEKDKNNASLLYPLSDFKPRKKEALKKGYLQGKYGALPYINQSGIQELLCT